MNTHESEHEGIINQVMEDIDTSQKKIENMGQMLLTLKTTQLGVQSVDAKMNNWTTRVGKSFEKKVKGNPYVINTSFGKTITFIFVLLLLFRIIIKGK